MKNVLVTIPFEDEYQQRLFEAAPNYNFKFGIEPGDLEWANIIIGNSPHKELSVLKNLEWVHLPSAGTEPYSIPNVLPENTILTNSTGAFGLAISEHMIACVTMLYKKLHLYRDNMAKNLWLDRGTVKRIEGSVVLIIGAGDIGIRFASKMNALGAYTIGVKRTQTPKSLCLDEQYSVGALDTLIPRADIIALALPGTKETKNIMNRERLFAMKRGAVLLNVGRGNAVDTEALCDALRSGHLYGASLDVTDPEPLPPEHPLWNCENALITPHISGFFHLRDTYEKIIDICIENVRRYHDGQSMLNVVDFETGYTMKPDANKSFENK